jgi:YVTN family beta-propeller protein/cysteine-rich repeat protein
MRSRSVFAGDPWPVLGLLLASMLAPAAARAASVHAYVVDGPHDAVIVIDTETNVVVTTIPVANEPSNAAALPDGSRLYVTHLWDQITSVIDTASNTVVATVPVGYEARHITALPDGSELYVSSHGGGRVDVIDPASNTVTDIISVGSLPWGTVALPDSSRVYVVHPSAVSVIDTATKMVVETIAVESNARYAAALPDGQSIFVTHPGTQQPKSGKLSVIDTATNSVVQVRMLTDHPSDPAVLPDGSRLFVPRSGNDTVVVVDTATLQDVANVPVGGFARDVAIVPDGSRAYVLSISAVWVLETTNNTVTAIIPIGGFGSAIAIASFPACGDGELDPGEVCDDGNGNETDCCSSACVPAAPAGTPCNDNHVCNGVETTCDANGLCQSTPPLDCDDGDLCTRDFCDETTGCFHQSDALLTCETAFARGSLLVAEDSPGNERVTAKFLKGPALSQLDFGNPLGLPSGTTAYALCIYDALGGLVQSLDVDRAGDACGTPGVTCWNPIGKPPPAGRGYTYKDAAAASDGMRKLVVKGGDAGKSKALVKAKNTAGLGQSALPTGIAAALAGSASATIQLVSSDASCLSITLDQVSRAQPTFFRAGFEAP